LGDDLDVFISGLQTGGNGNTLCCLDLVSSQHPDLNTCLSQNVNSLKNVVLKLILNTCYGEELHLVLQALDCLGYLALTINHACFSLFHTRCEVVVSRLRHQLLGDH